MPKPSKPEPIDPATLLETLRKAVQRSQEAAKALNAATEAHEAACKAEQAARQELNKYLEGIE